MGPLSELSTPPQAWSVSPLPLRSPRTARSLGSQSMTNCEILIGNSVTVMSREFGRERGVREME